MTRIRLRPLVPMFQYEHRSEPLLPLKAFWGRMARAATVGFALIAVSLGIGVVGYHTIGGLGWVDSVLNASMILTGMGPVDHMDRTGAKLFASGYAIFRGVAFLTSIGILFAPVLHRVMHHFHLDLEGDA